jgi:ribosomal protein S18 acetylase RimI-like enzyme
MERGARIDMSINYSTDNRPTVEEYVKFLKRSDLGSQYPRKKFGDRIRTLLENFDVGVTARDSEGRLVGVCFGITDFAYFLFVTDLGVARDYTRRGIGRTLMERIHLAAGGEADITMYTHASRPAIDFYKKCGMKIMKRGMFKEAAVYDEFDIRNEDLNELIEETSG